MTGCRKPTVAIFLPLISKHGQQQRRDQPSEREIEVTHPINGQPENDVIRCSADYYDAIRGSVDYYDVICRSADYYDVRRSSVDYYDVKRNSSADSYIKPNYNLI